VGSKAIPPFQPESAVGNRRFYAIRAHVGTIVSSCDKSNGCDRGDSGRRYKKSL